MATLLFAVVIQAWLSCLHSPQHSSPGLVSATPLSPSLISPLGSGSLCAPPPPPARAGKFRFFGRKEQTNSSLLKTEINLLGDSWEASRIKGAARCADLRRVLAWKLSAPSELVTLHLGQPLKHPVARPSHSRFNSPKRELAAGAHRSGAFPHWDWPALALGGVMG